MLIKTQLATTKIVKLERLKGCIEDELNKSREQEEERCKRQHPEAEEHLFFFAQDFHYQWEYLECSHKGLPEEEDS